MGLGPAAVKLNLELWQRGFYKNIKSVVDMGSQELHLPLADFGELCCAAGVPNYKQENFAYLANFPGHPRCSSKPFYAMLGVEKYSCIDLDGEHGAIRLDLNLPLEDSLLYGRYDLVTDYGNNEHAFNIAEAYRTMHRLCKEQGIIISIQAVYAGNGYYTFDRSFFEGIAAANHYKILFCSYVIITGMSTHAPSGDQFHIPLNRKLLNLVDWSKGDVRVEICYVLQKQSGSDFQCPYQGHYLSQAQDHHGYQLQFLPDPPSRTYVPIYKSALEAVRIRTLAQELFRRSVRKILGKV